MTDKERERLSEQLLNYRTAQGVVDRLDAAEALVREVEKQLFTEVETEASMKMEAREWRFADGVSLSRRAIEKGQWVTAEDPTMPGYGMPGKVLEVLPAEDGDPVRVVVKWPRRGGEQGVYSRPEVRDVRDQPPSAQIGMGAFWASHGEEEEA